MKQEKVMRDSAAAHDGATESSMGDASHADLDKGFTKENGSVHTQRTTVMPNDGGFLGRSGGWER